jgi:hypothetical protein
VGWISEAHLLDGPRIDDPALRELLHAAHRFGTLSNCSRC